MKPLKAKQLLPKVAEECDLPLDQVKLITEVYYRKVRGSLTGMKHIRVHLDNLGDFVIKYWLYDKYINKYTKILASKWYVNKTGPIVDGMREKLVKLNNSKAQYEGEQQRKAFIKLHKKATYDLERKNQESLEE